MHYWCKKHSDNFNNWNFRRRVCRGHGMHFLYRIHSKMQLSTPVLDNLMWHIMNTMCWFHYICFSPQDLKMMMMIGNLECTKLCICYIFWSSRGFVSVAIESMWLDFGLFSFALHCIVERKSLALSSN